MLAVVARYDGKKVILPKHVKGKAAADVIVIFSDPDAKDDGAELFAKVQQTAFAKAWDNDDDAIYDSL